MALSLKPLCNDHFSELFQFEYDNREWFEQWVPPRPAEYHHYESFCTICQNLISDANTGTDAFYLAYADDTLVGRFNLTDIHDRTADIGYRIAHAHIGKGYATEFTRQLIDIARAANLLQLNAQALQENSASTRILTRLGFRQCSDDPITVHLGQRQAHLLSYRLEL